MTANGQYIRVKRMTDTYFVSIDLARATVNDLYRKTATVMNVPEEDLRLCLMNDQGRVTFLEKSDSSDASNELLLMHTQNWTGMKIGSVVYAVLRLSDRWEEPCIVDYPFEGEDAENTLGK